MKEKKSDTLSALGPSPAAANFQPRQSSPIRLMARYCKTAQHLTLVFNVWKIVCHTNQLMTLLLGDVTSTNTPAGVGLGVTPQRFLQPSTIVEPGIDNFGKTHQIAPSLHP